MEASSRSTRCSELARLDAQRKESDRYREKVKTALDFYEGRQYEGTEPDPNMPRICLNVSKMAAESKAARVAGTPFHVRFAAFSREDGSPALDPDALRRFDEYVRNGCDSDTNCYLECVSAYVTGTGISYYRWDEERPQRGGVYRGGLKEESVDPLSFAVADPSVRDVQDQEWVMVWSDEPIETALSMLEGKGKAREGKEEALRAEAWKKGSNSPAVTVYTRYFRQDGEVYYECETDTVSLFEEPRPMDPSRRGGAEPRRDAEDDGRAVKDPYADAPRPREPSRPAKGSEGSDGFDRYPFAAFVPYPRTGSFYGTSDVITMRSAQQTLNFAYSMAAKQMQDRAYGKYIAKRGALGKGQTITSQPGQVIEDNYTGSGWGIAPFSSEGVPLDVTGFANSLLAVSREIFGFSPVMTGDVSNQDVSGYAVQQMISQANTVYEQQMRMLWRFEREKALNRVCFYRCYVGSASYSYEASEAETRADEQARAKAIGDPNLGMFRDEMATPARRSRRGSFDGPSLKGCDVEVTVVQGLNDSELQESEVLDQLLLSGNLANMDPTALDLWLKANPRISEETSRKVGAVIDYWKNSEASALKAQLREAQAQLEEMKRYCQVLASTAKYQEGLNQGMKKSFGESLKAAKSEATGLREALAGAGSLIRGGSPAAAASKGSGVTEGEGKSLNARGISGSDIA